MLRLASCACLTLLFACNEEPLDLNPRGDGSASMGGSGGSTGGSGGSTGGSGGSMGGSGGGSSMGGSGGSVSRDMGGPPRKDPPEPDMDRFFDEILPITYQSCSVAVGCHQQVSDERAPQDTLFKVIGPNNPDLLTEDEREAFYDEFVNFVTWVPAEESLLLVKAKGGPPGLPHDPTWPENTADYAEVLDWIDQATRPDPIPDMGVPEPDGGMGGSGGSGGEGGGGVRFPCQGVPDSDPIGREGYYETFRDSISPYLVGTEEEPGGTCSSDGCHEPGGDGGNLLLLPAGSEGCSTGWNFAAVQIYIDPSVPNNSPLLTQPIDPAHGGRVVWAVDDEGYLATREWVISGTLGR